VPNRRAAKAFRPSPLGGFAKSLLKAVDAQAVATVSCG
jgi:hypothetical protein